jgi:hypothetical protein
VTCRNRRVFYVAPDRCNFTVDRSGFIFSFFPEPGDKFQNRIPIDMDDIIFMDKTGKEVQVPFIGFNAGRLMIKPCLSG